MSNDLNVFLYSILKISLIISFIYCFFSTKKLSSQREMLIPIIGAIVFMYISWLVTYMAHIHPFIQPELGKDENTMLSIDYNKS
ncbi:hypothetical protein NUSPORA_00537 [Nucleospora cyclopteri]